MEDFKLDFYFNLYKDKALVNRVEFRKNFKKKHGEFQYIEELILMIEKYQLKKYGETLHDGKIVEYRIKEERDRINRRTNQQIRYIWKRGVNNETKKTKWRRNKGTTRTVS